MLRFLQWTRFVDAHDGRLSLTALAFAGSLVFLAVTQSWPGVCAFAVASALYAHRRALIHRADTRGEEMGALRADLTWAKEGIVALLDKSGKQEQRLAAVENRPRLR